MSRYMFQIVYKVLADAKNSEAVHVIESLDRVDLIVVKRQYVKILQSFQIFDRRDAVE